ncbi:MAG: serine hydrolase, partial [Pseudomonadota bacterium]
MNRRAVLGGAAGGALSAASGVEAEGAMDLAARLDLGVRAGLLRDLHAVLVIRNGAVLAEHYV